jgi:hypothetical protein
LLPVKVDAGSHQKMQKILEENPQAEWSLDLDQQVLKLPGVCRFISISTHSPKPV